MTDLTGAELEEIFGIKLVGKGQEVPKDAAKDFHALTDAIRETGKASATLSTETQQLDTSLKKTVGKDETEGLAGLATNALKAERALNALISGHGLARAAPMLESLLRAIGGPAGLGAAFVAMEVGARVLEPTLKKFAGAVSGEKADQMKAFAEAVKKLREEGEKLAASPLVSAAESAAKKFLEAGAGQELRRTMVLGLESQGFGLSEKERTEAANIRERASDEYIRTHGRMGPVQAAQDRQRMAELNRQIADASEKKALELLGEIGRGNDRAITEVMGIVDAHGKGLLLRMKERIEASLIGKKAEIEKEDFVGPPAPPPKTPDQRLREELMEQARAEDAAQQKRHGQAATPQFLKDVVGRAAAGVGAGMDRNAAMDQAIRDAQDAQRDRAESEDKKRERDAVHAEMQRRGFHGSPEQWDTVTRNAIKDLPMAAGNIMRAVQMGYMEAIRQMQQEAHSLNKILGNSFMQQGSAW